MFWLLAALLPLSISAFGFGGCGCGIPPPPPLCLPPIQLPPLCLPLPPPCPPPPPPCGCIRRKRRLEFLYFEIGKVPNYWIKTSEPGFKRQCHTSETDFEKVTSLRR
ncbi:hypothetical protein NECAME_10879 [Necator americanus]|uniref:Uncharacterized protein n=1 Tax=Necator americanus TaxID=51031 RepID=W2T6X1_NECAM|nr:hypothetical protein NECAME_10879 [Necator americanus]ETN77633.1 hypothetical protein NECAME_10879 [Necator americanus]